MNSGLLRLFFRMAMFITLTSGFLVIFVPRGSPEYVVSVMSLVLGLLLITLIIIANRFTKK